MFFFLSKTTAYVKATIKSLVLKNNLKTLPSVFDRKQISGCNKEKTIKDSISKWYLNPLQTISEDDLKTIDKTKINSSFKYEISTK